jgi:glyoxylase-like metal-dependent hydrolase (beta-lactamase superfamily II)
MRPLEVTGDLARLRVAMVNVYLYGRPGAGDRGWVLIDTGLPGAAGMIERAAAARFGVGTRPSAIVLTHGHFDHIGSLEDLLQVWDVPVFAHRLEMPYLTGRSPYPPADPLVGRGSMALLSRLYPRGPIDLGDRVRVLPEGGSVPDAPGWRWIHTPGHAPGHVSLYREADRTLVSGDAVITTKQESMSAVMTQRCELHGPPAYYTPDWSRARESVRTLATLAPATIVAGHGQPMSGEAMRERLYLLAEHFDALERPRFGRYATQPAIMDENGVLILPPDPLPKVLAGVGAVAATAGLIWSARAARRRMAA